MRSTFSLVVLLLSSSLTAAQLSSETSDDNGGYIGYHLDQRGDPEDTIYITDNTNTANSSSSSSGDSTGSIYDASNPPDVYLNASVSVSEIDIEVDNITAKVTLDAQVLSLLDINAGVDVSINRVALTIQDVVAKVELEARLGNILLMIGDVLDSLDLNPVLATLGTDLTTIINDTTSTLESDLKKRGQQESFVLDDNILYSINSYAGDTHTNRILAQDGSIFNQMLDNDGHVTGHKVVGSYSSSMTDTGHSHTYTTKSGQTVTVKEYAYAPFPGLSVISAIFFNEAGQVVATKVLSEGTAGGTSTVAADDETTV